MTLRFSNPARRKSLFPLCSYGGSWLLLTLWLRLCLPETLMGWERHQLFRFSAEYLTLFTTRPYPVLLYVQAFFTQFYLYPLLGAAVISGLLTLGIGAWHRLTGRFWTGLVWAAFMLPTLPYFNLLWILVWLVLLGGAVLIGRQRLPNGVRWGLTAGLAVVSAFLLQENVVWAVVFWSLISGLRTRSGRQGLYGFCAALGGAAAGIGLIFWAGYPLYYVYDLRAWALLRFSLIALYPYPAGLFIVPAFIGLWIYIGLLAGLCLPLVAWLKDDCRRLARHAKTTVKYRWVWRYGLPGLVTASLLTTSAYLTLRYQMEDSYLVERLAGEGNWTEAAEAAEHAFFERARPEAVGKNRALFLHGQRQRAHTAAGRFGIQPILYQDDAEETYMADMLKICLLASQRATNRLFAYNGSYYFPLLFPEEILNKPVSYLVALYYTQNGLHAEALHLLYDFVTCQRVCTAVLEPLLWNSVIVNDYEPCRKFIRFFEQSLFHKDIARRYTAYLTDTAQNARQPEIAAARTRLSTHNHTVLGYQPDDNIYFRHLYESDNAAVYEYALALWMVYKNHERILTELPKIRQYYRILPIHIQEAVLANFPPEQLDEAPADIHPGIKARYTAFLQAYNLYQNGYTSFQKLKKGFEDTYWYHLLFNDFKPITEMQPTAKNSGEI